MSSSTCMVGGGWDHPGRLGKRLALAHGRASRLWTRGEMVEAPQVGVPHRCLCLPLCHCGF